MPPEMPEGFVPDGAPAWVTVVFASVWGGLWIADKVTFYVSKLRNRERISSPQSVVDTKRLANIEESLMEVSGIIKRVASGVDKVHTRADSRVAEIAYMVREIRSTCDRIERRLDGIRQGN